MNDFPRRRRCDLYTPAETAIAIAMDFVERAGADERLTDAVNLLSEAKERVADFVDGVPGPKPFKLAKLLQAVRAIYFVARWVPDRPVENARELWAILRDAAGIPPGESTRVLGEAKHLFPVGVSVLLTRIHQGRKQLLLGRRKNNSAAGLLSTPGGRLEPKESIVDCALREFHEETGASIFSQLVHVVDWKKHDRFGDDYLMFYVHANAFAGLITNRIPEKNESWYWYDIDKIDFKECTEPPEIVLKLTVTPAEARAMLQQEFD